MMTIFRISCPILFSVYECFKAYCPQALLEVQIYAPVHMHGQKTDDIHVRYESNSLGKEEVTETNTRTPRTV